MVLRGSKTHPESPDIYQLEVAINRLKHYSRTLDTEEHAIEHEIAELLHEDDSQGGPLDIPKMQQSIHILLERLEYLERKHTETESKLTETKDELKIVLKQFLCGGLAGMTARTFVAPIDRVKLLIQTAFTTGAANRGIMGTAMYEIRNHGGIRAMWKGNLTNCIRVFPYAALQFATYERYKHAVLNWSERHDRTFGFTERLVSGAMAGATAATLTYPLDVMRLRQVVYTDVTGPLSAMRSIYAEGGLRFFFKGWTPTLLSLAPFIATNFATFDYLKARYIVGEVKDASPMFVLGLGACAGLTAQTFCYPLDTVRRSMQLKGDNFNGIADCMRQIWNKNGNPSGFYKGILPNAIKIVPNNGIRFLVYTQLCGYLGIPEKKIRPKRKD